jgi:uncharacterized protein YdeI (YjbR/CyaY-like superfamily)
VIAPRTQNELFEDLPAEGDLTEILRARVHRKDGGTAFPTEEHNEGTRPRVRWPDLAPGDVVEVVVRNWTSTAVGGRGDAPFLFRDYAGSTSTHPLLFNRVVVIAPKTHPLYVDVINGDPQKRIEKDENGRHITDLVWDKPPVIPEEPLAPDMTELVPMIVGSTFKTWTDFRTWYAEAVRGFTEPDDEVRRLAAELTKGKRTRDEKLRALFNFVADDIRYVNYVSGEWWLPNRPQQLLARREGDCDDKAMLLITLLKSVGIEAQEVMVQTRMTGMPSLVLAKKGIAEPTSLTYDQALEEALCFGWIDGQVRRRDEATYLQRFTRRRPRSSWSKRNVGIVDRLLVDGRVHPAGVAEVERARANGRWEAAYAGSASIEVPPDLAAALSAEPKARAMFEILSSQNRYAVLYRIGTAKRAETRLRRIEQLVAMLARGETVHPQKRTLAD